MGLQDRGHRGRKVRQQGFTLIELLISVVIIGILSAVAMPNFAAAQDRAKNAAVQANVHTCQLALEQYAVDTAGVYPKDETVFYTKVIKDPAYMAAADFAITPWETRQSRGISWPNASESVASGAAIARGQVSDPAKVYHYGAISYTVAKEATAQERYVLVGAGKRLNKAVVSAVARNF
jgi:prepilin-type N-terminal cleavage/methylation domain-containing protein